MYVMRDRGFTLIELLVVIAIIGTLASVVLASLNSARESARNAQRQSEMQQVVNAIELYALDNDGLVPPHGGNPNPHNVCTTCLGRLEDELVAGGFLPSIPIDPEHGHTNAGYRYCRASSQTHYSLLVRVNGDNWCNIEHNRNIPSGGGAECWVQNDGTPIHGWCDDEF